MDEWKEETLKMITVLMASYNGSRYIRQQLDSILAQDEEDVRILVSDDCSSDGSRELLKEYEASQGRSFFTDRKTPKNLAEQIIEELEIVTPGVATPVRKLSGGNVQKVLVGREISSNPKVLMVAYPVRGLDINSSYTIYHLLNEQKKQGAAVICVGEDLDVLLELCDRILVLCAGQVNGVVDGRTATKEQVGLMMTRTGGGLSE